METPRVLGRNLPAFVGVTMMVYAPLAFVRLALAGERVGRQALVPSEWITFALVQILPFVLQGALAYAVFQELGGERVPIVRSLKRGFRRSATVLATTVLVLLITSAVVLVPLLLGVALGGLYLGILGQLVGYAAAVFLQSIFLVAVPVAVTEEHTGPLRALAQSAHLTERSRGVLVLIVFALFVLGVFADGSARDILFSDLPTGGATQRAILLHVLVVAALGMLQAVTICVIHAGLVRMRQRVPTHQLAEVFD